VVACTSRPSGHRGVKQNCALTILRQNVEQLWLYRMTRGPQYDIACVKQSTLPIV
jgi:hypothetical protein